MEGGEDAKVNEPVASRIEAATASRNKLEVKYRLKEDPRYEEARRFQRENTHQAVEDLRKTTSPSEFGRVLDAQVIEPTAIKYGNEDKESYGSTLKAAYLERVGVKARAEIGAVLGTHGITATPEITRIFDLLPSAKSAQTIGAYVEELLHQPELAKMGDLKTLFEMAKEDKIIEFEAYYQREIQAKSYT